MTPEDRIKGAIEVAVRYGGIDGEHHKAWVIDQMVRHLTGCPTLTKTLNDCRGNPFECKYLGESEEYKELVRNACDGEDGPDTYEWDDGIAP